MEASRSHTKDPKPICPVLFRKSPSIFRLLSALPAEFPPSVNVSVPVLLSLSNKASPLISTERGLYAPLLKTLLPQPPAPSRMTEKSPFIVSDDDEAAPDARS